MKNIISPNTFLIGVQKAATTSIYSWLSQHPNICAPMSVKDYAFFTKDDFFNQGLEHLSSFYEGDFNDEDIILQGSVHYIFFEKALKRIFDFNPDSKFILVLRDPVERALSAYKYALKFDYENLNMNDAFSREGERMQSKDHRVISELTYKNHGLYHKQIQVFLKYFKRDQLKVVLYEDVSQPKLLTKELFDFLEIDSSFTPVYKTMNITGKIKNKTAQRVLLGDYKLKKWLMNSVINKLLSKELKAKLRWKIIHLNTENKDVDHLDKMDQNFRKELYSFFQEDIDKLEVLISRDLNNWKR